MAKKKPIIDVLLKPEDFHQSTFIDNYDCPVARAVNRRFKSAKIRVCWRRLYIGDKQYSILNGGFGIQDYNKIKNEYAKGVNRKWDHYIQIQKM